MNRMVKTVVISVMLLPIFLPVSATAFCFEQAGEYYNVSPSLIKAIARVESGLDPSAVNRNRDGSRDYGLMQVNSWWADKLGGDWSSITEPCYNVMAGTWILSQCISRFGYTWEAVGCYHTGKGDNRRAVLYIKKVQDVLSSKEFD